MSSTTTTGTVAFPALAAHWHVAIDTAAAAVTASQRAELLPSAYCAEELRHLRDESAWLASVRFV